ncbi:MAG: hypothetical protein LRY69_07120 [Gammaproteobacteria bacterium]|nr:hypothetical protein [Gammaproteobacteria bacterium]
MFLWGRATRGRAINRFADNGLSDKTRCFASGFLPEHAILVTGWYEASGTM